MAKITRTGRHKALRDMWDALMRQRGRPTIPPAPYEETPQYDVAPQPMQGAPVVPEEYTMGKLGYEAAPMPPNMPMSPNAPPAPPQLLSPHEQELLNQPQSEYDFMLAEIERIRAGLPQQGQMPAVQQPQPAPAIPMASEAPAPTISPEEQWMLDEQAKIAEIRRKASTFSPEYAEYGQPIPEAAPLWEDPYPRVLGRERRREALTELAPIHEGRRTAIRERFTEQRARKRERQLERGAAPTPAEMMEHEIELAGLGRTYPPAAKLPEAPESETEKELLDAMFNIQRTMANLDPDSPEHQIQASIFVEIQNRLAAMQGGSIVEQPTPFVDRQWPRRNIPAGTERRFVPSTDVKLQSAPDIRLNPYWDKLDDGSKQQLWQIYEDPEKLKIALQRLQQTYGAI